MKSIKIHDFPMPDDVAKICDIQNEYYGYPLGERYYMAYETDPNRPISTLFNDLKWFTKHYGTEPFNENCDITDESFNRSRDINIARNKDMLKRNIVWWDYDHVKENGMVDITDNLGNKTSRTYKAKIADDGTVIPARTVTEREPRGLTKSQKEHLRLENNKGRYILCRYQRN